MASFLGCKSIRRSCPQIHVPVFVPVLKNLRAQPNRETFNAEKALAISPFVRYNRTWIGVGYREGPAAPSPVTVSGCFSLAVACGLWPVARCRVETIFLQHPENKYFSSNNYPTKRCQSDSKTTANRQQSDSNLLTSPSPWVILEVLRRNGSN